MTRQITFRSIIGLDIVRGGTELSHSRRMFGRSITSSLRGSYFQMRATG